MYISFQSVDSENHKIEYLSEATLLENWIEFEDKSCVETKILLRIDNGQVELKREGFINMSIKFHLYEVTCGAYVNTDGLDFEFEIYTSELQIEEGKLMIKYDMIMDDEVISRHFIQLAFIENNV